MGLAEGLRSSRRLRSAVTSRIGLRSQIAELCSVIADATVAVQAETMPHERRVTKNRATSWHT